MLRCNEKAPVLRRGCHFRGARKMIGNYRGFLGSWRFPFLAPRLTWGSPDPAAGGEALPRRRRAGRDVN
jgi:hypothetical protein